MRRDAVYNALLQQLSALLAEPYIVQGAATNVLTVSRGFVMWDQADSQPAIYIVPRSENADYAMGKPIRWLLTLDLYVYVRWTDSAVQAAAPLATVMDNIDYILSPTGPNGSPSATYAVNTLGGLATYCALKGGSEISLGFLGGSQAVARMPLEILVPG